MKKASKRWLWMSVLAVGCLGGWYFSAARAEAARASAQTSGGNVCVISMIYTTADGTHYYLTQDPNSPYCAPGGGFKTSTFIEAGCDCPSTVPSGTKLVSIDEMENEMNKGPQPDPLFSNVLR